MDDTNPSRTTDASAVRKRRSSILKNQRPHRAPLSELEFTAPTSTDNNKSRRVSFSKRTGVAEFVTNEATTTWKNFYEEHNDSLHSSGNESGGHPPRQSVGHLGKRIFEDQFQVEAIDFGSTASNVGGIDTSINNVKFALDCTDNKKLSIAEQNFEFSQMTAADNPSKVFGDALAMSGFGEVTDKINVNFSTLQPVGDDLDEIQKDLERVKEQKKQNFICQGPDDGPNMSGYIEVDLNVTHMGLGQCDSTEDMSITDTIHSPKVNVSKNSTSNSKSLDKDWVADKENIAVNPYVAPEESDNFAINENPNQILFFDGKRLTVQCEKEPMPDYKKDVLPSVPQRKTIVLNTDDDLPNFIDKPHNPMHQYSNNMSNRTVLDSDCDISMTQAVSGKIETVKKQHTIMFENSSGDISMTQAVPNNVNQTEKRRTIVFDNAEADISMTQAVPTNFMSQEKLANENDVKVPSSNRKTIVFENEGGNLSMTQALPMNLIMNESQQKLKKLSTMVVYKNESGNISVTEIKDENAKTDIKSDKRNTIVFNNEENDISITKAIPSNIIMSNEVQQNKKTKAESLEDIAPSKSEKKRNTIVFDEQDGNISITTAIPSNLLFSECPLPFEIEQDKSKTVVFDEENGVISITKIIDAGLILPEKDSKRSFDATYNQYEKENLGAPQINNPPKSPTLSASHTSRKSKISLSYDYNNKTEQMDISLTQAVPSNILLSEMLTSLPYEANADISLTQAVPSNLILTKNNDESNKSEIDELPPKITKKALEIDEAQQTSLIASVSSRFSPETEIECSNIVYEDDYAAMTKALQKEANLSEVKRKLENKSESDYISACKHKEKSILMMSQSEEANLSEVKRKLENKSESDYISACKHKEKSILMMSQSDNINAAKSVPMDVTSPVKDENKHSIKRKSIKDESKNIDLTPSIDDISSNEDVRYLNIDALPLTIAPSEDVKTNDGNSDKKPVLKSGYLNETTSLEYDVLESKSFAFKGFSIQNEERSENLHSFVMAQMGNAIHPIPQDLITLEKAILKSTNCLTKATEGKHLKDVMVYQATTKSDMRPEKFELNSIIETPERDTGRLINTDYVTVTHKLPIPLHNTDLDTKDKETPVESNVEASGIQADISEAIRHNVSDKPETERDDSESSSSRESIAKDIDYKLIDSESAVDMIQKTIEKSILNDLLDMDNPFALKVEKQSIPALEDKPSKIDDCVSVADTADSEVQSSENSQSEQIFFITKDSNIETQTEKSDEASIGNQSPDLRLSEAHLQQNLGDLEKKLLEYENPQMSTKCKYYRDADNTKELLDMLSKFTEKEEMYNPIKPIKSFKKGGPSSETKGILRRQSAVLCREDLANNISMANAMLSNKACITDPVDDSDVDSPNQSSQVSPSRSLVSNDVVKTLRFEDEDYATDTVEDVPTLISTPLKKTAFGETAYMAEFGETAHKKGRVIPTYLKDVSDGIKSLMSDLVKPMVDVVPFDSYHEPAPKAGTRTKQIQANLFTSSQIDLQAEPSDEEMAPKEVRRLKSIIKSNYDTASACSEATDEPKHVRLQPSPPFHPNDSPSPPIIKFDPANPLNNILIAPPPYHEVHRYQPSTEEQSTNRYFNVSFKDEDTEEDRTSETQSANPSEDRTYPQFNLDRVIHSFQSPIRENSNKSVEKGTNCSSNTSFVNVSVETIPTRTSDEAINTVIAMQDNNKLLENESALTLVDSVCEHHLEPSKETYPSNQMEVTVNPTNEQRYVEIKGFHKKKKHDKRRHSNCNLSSLEVTPKSASKKPRRSPRSDNGDRLGDKSIEKSYMKERAVPNVIVHNCTTVFNRQVDSSKVEEGNCSSVTPSSTGVVMEMPEDKDMGDVSSLSSNAGQEESHMVWQPDLLHELSSKNLLTECESSADVLETINILPFMGSSACEWESSTDSQWSFRLLHRRLKLTVHLDPQECQGFDEVRADTPVKDITVDTVDLDKLANGYAVLCFKFARDTMRHLVTRGCCRAGDVPALLRRAAAIARVALRLGRAFYDAWLRLAFTLTSDGKLTLKVVNIPLRSMWEVSMHIELVTDDSSEVPWPRARDVKVTPLFVGEGDSPVTSAQIQRALEGNPPDWGHAPRAIWKIFRYLKNRTQHEEIDCLRRL